MSWRGHVARTLSREILPFFRLQKGVQGEKREKERERGIGGEDPRLRKVENLNSGAVPPPRCDRRRLVSGDWLAAGKGVRDPCTGVEEICAVTPGRRRVHVRPNPVPFAPEYDSRRRPSRACSRGSCRLRRRRSSTISRVIVFFFFLNRRFYYLDSIGRSCSRRIFHDSNK